MNRAWLSCLCFLIACPSSTPTSPTPPAPDAGVKSATTEIFEASDPKDAAPVEDGPAPQDAETLLQGFGGAQQSLSADRSLTDDELQAALLATATCEVVAVTGEIAPGCKPVRLARSIHLKSASDAKARARLAKIASPHLSHPRAATRASAILWHTDQVGATPEHRDRLLRLAGRERHPQPLGAYVRALRPFLAANPKVHAFILKASHHQGAYVRRHAAYALAGPDARKISGSIERVEALALQDPDLRVRTQACERLGSLGDDDRGLSIIETFVDAPGKNPKMYEACLRGLIGAWAAPVPPRVPSKAAYEKTLAILKKTPRTHGVPDFRALLRLRWAASPASLKAAPFISLQDLRAALSDVIVDDDVGWIGRVALVDVLLKLQATKPELLRLRDERLQGKGERAKRDHVIRKITEVVSKM